MRATLLMGIYGWSTEKYLSWKSCEEGNKAQAILYVHTMIYYHFFWIKHAMAQCLNQNFLLVLGFE